MGGRWCKIYYRTERGQTNVIRELNPPILPEQDSAFNEKTNIALWLIHHLLDTIQNVQKVEASIWMAKVDWGSVYILSLNSSYQT